MKADKQQENTSKKKRLLPTECKYDEMTEDEKDVDVKVSIISQKEVKKVSQFQEGKWHFLRNKGHSCHFFRGTAASSPGKKAEESTLAVKLVHSRQNHLLSNPFLSFRCCRYIFFCSIFFVSYYDFL